MPSIPPNATCSPGGININDRPLTLFSMGGRLSRAIPTRKKQSQIYEHADRLLHEMGGSRANGDYHKPKSDQIPMKERYLSIHNPKEYNMDNGLQFNEVHYREWYTGLGIKVKYSSPGHPQTNGQVEVTNKTLLTILKKKVVELKSDWADELFGVL